MTTRQFNESVNADIRRMTNKAKQDTDLPAYRVYYEDGSSYVTSMANGITLQDARKYFVGLWITQPDESSMRVCDVQPINNTKQGERRFR